MKWNTLWPALLLMVLAPALPAQETPFKRGVNLTGWFQAPSAQAINFGRYGKQDFEQIRNLGADVIRLPINLHPMTSGAPDWRVDPLLLDYLDQVVDWAEELDLHLILDNHTFDPAADTDPAVEGALLKIWPQLAAHFRDRSQRLYYEVLNEPHGIADDTWNAIQQQVVAAIRAVDPVHTIIVGPAGWNSYNNLAAMPDYADDNLIYTFHFYDPFLFTHQGASWVTPSMEPLRGVPYPYRAADMPPLPSSLQGSWVGDAYAGYATEGTAARVRELLDIAIAFREARGVPIFLGELGVLMSWAQDEDRVRWYREVREYLDEHEVSWTSWDYHGGFGLFRNGTPGRYDHDLNLPLLDALGFHRPPQSEPVAKPDSVGFNLYLDALAPGVTEAGYTSGSVDLASPHAPHQGRRSIEWRSALLFDTVGLAFNAPRDLAFLAAQGYRLQLALRCTAPAGRVGVRFLDTFNGEPDDRPWRMGAVLENAALGCVDGWAQLDLPLAELAEQGAWHEGQWYNPQGAFDWTAVERLEIVAETPLRPAHALWIDRVRISREAARAPQLASRRGLNGLFYDPAAPGHGFDFNVVEAGLMVFYYGHTAGGERLWLLSSAFDGRLRYEEPFTLDVFEVPTGEFGAPASGAEPWGTMTLVMHDCNHGRAELDGLDGLLDMDLTRLAGVDGVVCDPE